MTGHPVVSAPTDETAREPSDPAYVTFLNGGFRGGCKCGWRGGFHDSYGLALDDKQRHECRYRPARREARDDG